MIRDKEVVSHFSDRQSTIRIAMAPKIIAQPLYAKLEEANANAAEVTKLFRVVIELNALFPEGISQARATVIAMIQSIVDDLSAALGRDSESQSYVYASLTAEQVLKMVSVDAKNAADRPDSTQRSSTARAIFKVWDSPPIGPLCDRSIRTIKADAAQNAFSASGEGITWAVMDSGIECSHPHFATFANTTLQPPIAHRSFMGGDPTRDAFGHGTHVAGIIAGMAPAVVAGASPCMIAEQSCNPDGDTMYQLRAAASIRGMAPQCRLLSLQVLDDSGGGDVTALLQAIEYVQQLNGNGKMVVVHGVNISVGYPFDAQWYACGQTPVCREINRLVSTGVVVIVAAGNTGHVTTMVNVGGALAGTREAGQSFSINDPGNADLALTVGSTDREQPHTYGISYFSSKGPTGDGRLKPDLVAPGEHIVSAAAGDNLHKVSAAGVDVTNVMYVDDTGTSMAAPHVSGAVAAFLSVRREFIGQATLVRDLVKDSAVDLQRDRSLQGAGLVDVMRLIQSV